MPKQESPCESVFTPHPTLSLHTPSVIGPLLAQAYASHWSIASAVTEWALCLDQGGISKISTGLYTHLSSELFV